MNIGFTGVDITSQESFTDNIKNKARPIKAAIWKSVDADNFHIDLERLGQELTEIKHSYSYGIISNRTEHLVAVDVLRELYKTFSGMFGQNIIMSNGEHTMEYLIDNARNDGKKESTNNFPINIAVNGGHQCSYQICFYSGLHNAFCFMIMHLEFIKVEESFIGIEIFSESTESYHIQVFKVE